MCRLGSRGDVCSILLSWSLDGLLGQPISALQVAKNIVLAGVGSLALMDDTACSAADPGNFLVPADADLKSRYLHNQHLCNS